MEIWKDIPGYEGRYQVSNYGNVKSVSRLVNCRGGAKRRIAERLLRPGRVPSGHLYVVLGRGEHGSPVHQLVLKAFEGSCPIGCEVLHNNGDPTDNRLENLRYGTRQENVLDALVHRERWRKLSKQDVIEIRKKVKSGCTQVQLADDYHVSVSAINAVVMGRTFGWLL